MKKRGTWWALCTVTLAVLAIGVVLINLPPRTDCVSKLPADTKQYWFQATQTVVQPWLGPHHVYATFTIPAQYKFDHLYSAKLTIQGFETDFVAASPEVGDIVSVGAEPGYYTKRVYVSTRTAFWFLATGQFGDLKTSCHWWLAIIDRGWQPTGTPSGE